MKKILLIITYFIFSISLINAQPGLCPPGQIDDGNGGCIDDPNVIDGDPSNPVPIDGGASLLLIGGAGIAAYRMRKNKKNNTL